MKSDLQIAQEAKPVHIDEIAKKAGIPEKFLVPFGWMKAKVSLGILEANKDKPDGKYIDVTAITPTPLGEGKTTTTVGLTQAMGQIKKNVFCCIRQPSMGPTFGIKGGAAGGGYSQVVPMEDFNLHLTGDIHAISLAHNLVAAAIDTRIMHERNYSDERWGRMTGGKPKLLIDPYSIVWRRVVDVNDRSLRNIVVGMGEKGDGVPRQTGFDITVASELMAILALSGSLQEMKERISKVVIGYSYWGNPVTIEDMNLTGAVTVLMKDAIMPNLMQTIEGQPAFVHAGPFANIAHGNSSIIADKIALKLADYVITESGFGADIGMEKFMDIKCRYSGLKPNAVVLVATIRALKMHGGGPRVAAGKKLDSTYTEKNMKLLENGFCNLERHIEIAKKFRVPCVVAINQFDTDDPEEVEYLVKAAEEAGAFAAVPTTHHADGGKGAVALAEATVAACDEESEFKPLYPLDIPIKDKILIIAREIYGAEAVVYDMLAEKQIRRFERKGFGKLPICMAKTHLSLSHDPSLKGAPRDFVLPIREVRASIGAGFIYPLCGSLSTMPGLPSKPAYEDVDIDENGVVRGLF